MLTMLATALLGGQVFAAEPTGTDIQGTTEISETKYYGLHTDDSRTATGGNVTVKKDDSGEVPASAVVYGGCADEAAASNNTVTMQGGTVQSIYGGHGYTGASNNKVTMQGGNVSEFIYGGNGGTAGDSYNNTVIMTGGSVNKTIYGGASGDNYTASDNVVIVTGGSIKTLLIAGIAGAAARDNKVHLVGKGASNVNIADAQSNIGTYNGSNGGISLSNVIGGRATKTSISTGNSIDIYGTGIEISGMFAYMQVLTFNITNDAVTAQTPEVAVTLTSTSSGNALDLTGVDLQVKDLNVEEWSAGMTVTLVQSKQEIKGASEELKVGKVVDITDATGAKVAQGKLQLVDGVEGTHLLNLTIQGSVPEPTTGTLSLLALAGLCMRKRRK